MTLQPSSKFESPASKELDVLAKAFANNLLASTSRVASLIGFEITLLEVFKFQVNKLKLIGYCDYALAYLVHRVTTMMIEICSSSIPKEMQKFLIQVSDTLTSYKPSFIQISSCLQHQYDLTNHVNPDVLMQRFANLKTGVSGSPLSTFKRFSYSDSVTVTELNQLIRRDPEQILMLDFRTKKEFSFSHVNFLNVINIEPSIISHLLSSKSDANDVDLEDRLRAHLTPESFQKFCNRHRYGLIVIYNLRFGGISNDKYQSLEYLLINEDKNGVPSSNPFRDLIELIMYKTKYLSSALKQYPVYLAGGLERWYNTFGEGALTRESLSENSKRSTLSNGYLSIEKINDLHLVIASNSPYLRSFGDYLASAKSISPPISLEATPGPSQRMNVHDYGTQSANISQSAPFLISKASGTTVQTSSGPETKKVVSADSNLSTFKPPEVKNLGSTTLKIADTGSILLRTFATGLTNLGNSCYMNCVLQCLGATPQLTAFFFPTEMTRDSQVLQSYRQHINKKNSLGTKGIVTTNFVKLLANMFNNTGKYFSPKDFKQVVGSLSPGRQFATFDQQDCIEFLNFILDSLHEDLNQRLVESAEERAAIMDLSPEQEKTREILPVRLASTIEWERYLKLNFSVIVDYFQGQYLSQLRCLECQLTSTTYNSFSILSLPIPEKFDGVFQKVLLSQCLDLFTETELLDDDNKWHCPNCQKFTKLTKKITITRFPRVLIIHFKRFKMQSNGYFNKLDTFVTYPVNEVLDLTSYWPPVGTYINPKTAENIDLDKEMLLLSSLPSRNQSPPFKYKLYGVVNHFGNLTTGHYTSYVQKESDSKQKREWCYFDDAKVHYQCEESQVSNKNAYCLFFQRI